MMTDDCGCGSQNLMSFGEFAHCQTVSVGPSAVNASMSFQIKERADLRCLHL